MQYKTWDGGGIFIISIDDRLLNPLTILDDNMSANKVIENQVSSLSEIFNSPPAYILDALIRSSPQELSIHELIPKTALSKHTLQNHLPHLVEMGLVLRSKLAPHFGPLKYKLNWANPLARQLYKTAAYITDGQSTRV